VTTGPRDPMAAAAAGRGHLRASDADREQVLDILKAAFVQGRLVKDELDIRAGQTLSSRTYAELAAITADIPVAPIEPPPQRPPLRPVRTDIRKPVNKKAVAWSTCAVVLPPTMGAAFLTYYGGFVVLFLLAFIGFTVSSRS
jgi:Domain of unknown function (DUF1707)